MLLTRVRQWTDRLDLAIFVNFFGLPQGGGVGGTTPHPLLANPATYHDNIIGIALEQVPTPQVDVLVFSTPFLACFSTKNELRWIRCMCLVQVDNVVICILVPVKGNARHIFGRLPVLQYGICPNVNLTSLVIKDHEFGSVESISSRGQNGSQIQFNEVSLQFGCESQTIAGIVGVITGFGLVLDRQIPTWEHLELCTLPRI